MAVAWKVDRGEKTLLKSNHIELNLENSVFQLFFLLNNENQDIEVVETQEVDFTEVKKRLEKGESVFITRKRKQEAEPVSLASEESEDP
jgi:hypothetical protein